MLNAAAQLCPEPSSLLDWVEGLLAATDRPALDEHLDACSRCRDVVASLVRARSSSHLPTTPSIASAGTDVLVLRRGELLGRYRIDGLLGRGGMGVVYLAFDTTLNRQLALKVSSANLADFEEARFMAAVAHPHLLKIFDVSRLGSRTLMALELVDGPNFNGWLARRPKRTEVLRVLCELAEGLAALHSAGIVHRDVKPDNMLVFNDGRAVVADMGLAQRAAVSGHIGGTRGYAAPEVATAAHVDARADQYSFCVCAVEALCEPPASRQHVREWLSVSPTRALAGVPSPYRAVLARGLCRDPAQRFSDMNTLVAALRAPQRRRQLQQRGAMVAGVLLLLAALVTMVAQSPAVQCRWRARQQTQRVRTALSQLVARHGQVPEVARSAQRLEPRIPRYHDLLVGACLASDSGGDAERAYFRCLDDTGTQTSALLSALTAQTLKEPGYVLVSTVRQLLLCAKPALVTPMSASELAGVADAAVVRFVRGDEAARQTLDARLARKDQSAVAHAWLLHQRAFADVETDPEAAIARFEQTIVEAEVSREWTLAANAGVDMLEAVAATGYGARLRQAIGNASTLLRRAPKSAQQSALVLQYEADLAAVEGRGADALAAAEHAIAELRQASDIDEMDLMRAYFTLGTAHIAHVNPTAALAAQEQSLAYLHQATPRIQPDIEGGVLWTLVQTAIAANDGTRAAAYLPRLEAAAFETTNPSMQANATRSAVNVLLLTGAPQEARARIDRLRALMTAHAEELAAGALSVRLLEARVLLATGDNAGAVKLLSEPVPVDDVTAAGEYDAEAAQILASAGQPVLAKAMLLAFDRLRLQEPTNITPLSEARAALAQADLMPASSTAAQRALLQSVRTKARADLRVLMTLDAKLASLAP